MPKPLDPRTVTAALNRAGFQRSVPCPEFGSVKFEMFNTPGFRCGKLPDGRVIVRLYGGQELAPVYNSLGSASGLYGWPRGSVVISQEGKEWTI